MVGLNGSIGVEREQCCQRRTAAIELGLLSCERHGQTFGWLR
jgi:hypothetical protein